VELDKLNGTGKGNMKVAILGSTGMLGSMVRRYLSEQPGYELTCPLRKNLDGAYVMEITLASILRDCDYVINCIGVIKPSINEDTPASVRNAIQINALFPIQLAHAAEWMKFKVLQIATDCVYSGATGSYTESSPHDPLDVYGKTKSLGEVCSPYVHHLRCSIIGPEQKSHLSLLDWFLKHGRGAVVKGFTNHQWNGITTLAFAKICHGVMSLNVELPHMQHIVPLNAVSKFALLRHIRDAYDRLDVRVEPVSAPTQVDRTLATEDDDLNKKLWLAAGYAPRPSIAELVGELVAYRQEDSE
jgi:dTDP-4-dehydrorhamnose reductase